MKKQVLMLSVALAALAVSPAFADDWTDITTDLNVPVNTAAANNGAPGDITIESTASVSVSLADAAALTIDSSNAVNAMTGSEIANTGADGAIGVLVDLTTVNRDSTTCTTDGCLKGLTLAGVITLTGTGETKRAVWLKGPGADSDITDPVKFIGDINMSGGTTTITGDASVGMQIDSLAELDGNLTFGTLNMNQTSATSAGSLIGLELDGIVKGDIHVAGPLAINGNSAAAAGGALIGMNITGSVYGDLIIDTEGSIAATGTGSHGILISGSLNACDQAVTAGCTSTGALVNNSSLRAGANAINDTRTGNGFSSSALAIGGNIAGGIFNAGSAVKDDSVSQGQIVSLGSSPTISISPSFQTGTDQTPITIDIYQGDKVDPFFSFYNRGLISSSSLNDGDTQAIFIGSGVSTAPVTVTGGLYNSGGIESLATSTDVASPANAAALNFGSFSSIGAGDTYTIRFDGTALYNNFASGKIDTDELHSDQAALVNNSSVGTAIISATLSGSGGGTATAISIGPNATLPSIINTGQILASAFTTDTTNTLLRARAIVDSSGTLQYIQNNGLISASTTTLDDGSQQAIAIDLSSDALASDAGQNGVLILNQATISTQADIEGDIKFGQGQMQIVNVMGASTNNLATITGDISYGGGFHPGSDRLMIGDFATVTGKVTADAQLGVTVDVFNGGTFNVLNDSTALNAFDFDVHTGGTVNLHLIEGFRTGIIDAIDTVDFEPGAKLNIDYASFISSERDFVLISAPRNGITISDLEVYRQQLNNTLPYLFASAELSIDQTDPVDDRLLLKIIPKDPAALGLTGYAAQIQPFANLALSNDDVLGAAFVSGIVDQKTAQLAYNEMAPDVSGGARALAIALTDQSSGPVAVRQRVLRMYGKEGGDVTLWGEEFAEFITDPGNKSTGQTGFKDHGFGFVLGLDGGDPRSGWYGGAFSFYSGDIVEPLPRDSHSNTLWYMLTGYTDWRGRGLFLDTKADIGYMTIKSKRFIDLTLPSPNHDGTTVPFVDEADSKRPGLVGALGMTTGAILNYGSTTFTPQISLDGMTMRQDGYTETHPTTSPGNGKGLLLQTRSFYASSARVFIGTEIREDLNLGDFFVQPDLRLGYRYDFLNDATKLKTNFVDIGTNSTPTPGQEFTVIGPDPAQGNFVAGASIAATTDAWTLGANFDFVRGTNGATTEIGTIHLLGRI